MLPPALCLCGGRLSVFAGFFLCAGPYGMLIRRIERGYRHLKFYNFQPFYHFELLCELGVKEIFDERRPWRV